MRRLAREAMEERKPRPARFFSAKKALIAVAPLVAGIIAGCGDASGQRDECRIYNETTITLDRGTDGRGADLRALESIPQGSFLTDYQIDFINEAHAIASEGIPTGTRATQSPSYCLQAGTNGGLKSAYAQQTTTASTDRGLYVPENPALDPITLINLVNHELGHLQPGNPENGSEVMSQINEYEQKLAGFALLIDQGADEGQLIRWASHESRAGLFSKLARTLESGRGRPGGDSLDGYDKANMFIFTRLGETGGDIPGIRAEFRELVESGGLEAALDDASSAFLGIYTADNLADLFVDSRARLINAMQRQFGAADSYFQAHSRLLDSSLASGLDGMNCAFIVPLPSAIYTPCSDAACVEAGADSSRPVAAQLCCVSAEVRADGIGYSKWSVEASGTRYRKNGGTVGSYDFEWDSITSLSAVKTAIGMDEPCG